jgi:hypothetical protein
VLGYYQMSGYTSFIAADIRSSKNIRNAARGTTDPDFTEAQWFDGSGYSIGAICQGQVGLGVSIKPFPLLLGGYQINIADTLLALLPNEKQNIYVRKTPTDRLSNEVYSTTEDEPSGFTKQLIATVVTDDELVTTAVAKPVGVAIPPSDESGTRYLSITAGVCGWVRATDIVTGGSSVISGYTLPAATTNDLGGVKVGTGLTVGVDGTLSVTASTSSLNANGYTYAGGILMQWGYATAVPGDSYSTITFPLAFPTAVVNVTASMVNTNASTSYLSSNNIAQVGSVTTSGFHLINNLESSGPDFPMYWFALGY